jgi:hypothetical protein
MFAFLHIFASAFSLWWGDSFLLSVFNLAWVLLQIPIVTGPPATAAIFAISKRIVDGEVVELGDSWRTLHEMFVPAWKWAGINLIVVAALVGNFWLYRDNPGLIFTLLRFTWGAIFLIWFSINLFYWPFWLRQQSPSVVTTLKNSFIFLARHPVLVVGFTIMTGLLFAFSIMTIIPLMVVAMALLSLAGTRVIKDELLRTGQIKNPEGLADDISERDY